MRSDPPSLPPNTPLGLASGGETFEAPGKVMISDQWVRVSGTNVDA